MRNKHPADEHGDHKLWLGDAVKLCNAFAKGTQDERDSMGHILDDYPQSRRANRKLEKCVLGQVASYSP
jgi:hypothetical protein